MEQPMQEAPRDESPESEFIDQMVAEAVDYVFNKELDNVVSVLQSTDDTAGSIGALSYKTTRGILEKHKDLGMSMEIDMSVAMAVNTEVIDMLVEVLQKIDPAGATDAQRLREDALLKSITMHGESLEGQDGVKEEAETMLRGFMQDGSVDQAFNYVNNRAAQDGLNVDDMIRSGDEMLVKGATGNAMEKAATPQKTPVAQGVDKALMGAANG